MQTGTGLLGRLRAKFASSPQSLSRRVGDLLLGKRTLDRDLLEELESVLLSADVGVETTQQLVSQLSERLARHELADARAAYDLLRQSIEAIVQPCAQPLTPDPAARPFVIMAVGVNGVGKTTTISKLAWRFKNSGLSVMLAAGDTFRAAAIEQLKVWGERLGVPVIAQQSGADAAAVAHDALSAATARRCQVLIIDTAGRQHTHAGLMEEIVKIKRVVSRLNPGAPHEILLVLDAGTGQNALSQLKHFNDAVGVTGICLTKLDGTARGGVLIAIAHESRLPIRYVGIGEGTEDLQDFSARDYVDTLLPPGQG